MCDADGNVIEGTMSNLLAIHGGTLLTPDLSRCGVAGVLRQWLMDRAQLNCIEVQIKDIGLEELLAADDAILCNSIIGAWPIKRLQDKIYPIGAVCRQLIEWSRPAG